MTHPSTTQPTHRRHPWIKRLAWAATAWLLLVGIPSIEDVRAILTLPLYVHQEIDQVDAAYIMAGGYSYLERLRAAADLYHQGKTTRLVILDEQSSHGYSYTQQTSVTMAEYATAFLGCHGVPPEAISRIPELRNPAMGSLSEAQSFAEQLGASVQSVAVVTSAPHTRRSRLCFQRELPPGKELFIVSASEPRRSAERYSPIWLEYFKLAIYWAIA
jgi:uncharacterized SAM-binding protein YcdF (DUF218 family)